MPNGASVKRPLPTVLAELALEKRGLVLMQGQTYFRVEDQASQARREAKSGPSETRRFLQAHDFWWDEDPDGLVVVYQDTPGGPKPLAAEIGSRLTPLALDEGDWGREMVLSGSLGRVRGCAGFIFERRCYDVGKAYGFDELPSQTRRDAIAQTDDFLSHFDHRPDAMQYRFLIIPHDEVLRVLSEHFGDAIPEAMKDPKVKRLARSIMDEGLKYPPIADEGWKRSLAVASLGMDLPYFEVIPPFDVSFEPAIPTMDGMSGRKFPRDPKYKDIREGYWRMLQRIHQGIPGFVGTGRVEGGQFTGGNAGVNTAWVVKPYGTMGMIDAVSVAGFYLFGTVWPDMLKLAGLPNNASEIVRVLDEEFGIASDRDLKKGTVPNPEGSMGRSAIEAASF